MSKYVNVDEYKRHLDMICRSGYTQQIVDVFIEWFLSIADSIATEDVVPVVHAHWTYEIDDLFPADSMMICSNCGEYERLGANDNYCGNCGAKMDEEVS